MGNEFQEDGILGGRERVASVLKGRHIICGKAKKENKGSTGEISDLEVKVGGAHGQGGE